MTFDHGAPARSAAPAHSDLPRRAAFFVFLAAALGFSIFFSAARLARPRPVRGPTLEDLVQGRASGHVQHRALVPWLARALAPYVTPAPGEPAHVEALRRIELIATFLACVAVWALLARVLESELSASFATFSLFGVLPYTHLLPRVEYFPYDLAALSLFTAGLVALRARSWGVYYPLFVLATLNRETSCFLTVIQATTAAGREPAARILRHLVAQAALWFAIKLWLVRTYGPRLFTNHWDNNLEVLTDPTHYPVLLSAAGFLFAPALLFAGWIPDVFVRRALLVVIPFAGVMLVAGNVLELRIFGELVPLALAGWWALVRRAVAAPAFGAEPAPPV